MTRLPSEGETFGRYQLRRVLGAGGMGMVYAAHDPVLDREVALKLVVPHLAGDPEFRARFQHEAEVLARLDSDRIVRIFDHGEHEGSLFIVTQLVEGGDLQKLVAGSGPLSPALAVEVVCQVLEGLRDAHAVGVVHRDIKPANVLLRQRHGEVEAFLCDFGIAAAAERGFTRTGGVAGSLPYMAPERHEGRDATSASDVYAVGCLLWHGLTGSAPYVGTDVEVAMAHIEGRVPQLPGRDDFSRRTNAVLAKAMAKDPRKRYASAKAMASDLRPLLEKAPGVIALPGATALRRPLAVRRRRWVPAVVGAGSVLAVVSVVGGLVWLGNADEPAGRREALPVPATLTETVSVGRDLLLGNQVTLAPRPVRSTQADGDVVLEAPPVHDELPVADSPAPPAAGDEPAGSGEPKVRPERSEPPAPAYRYRCWSGEKVVDLDSCSMPSGEAGLRWVFLTGSGISCSRDDSNDAQRIVLDCPYAGGGRLRPSMYRSVGDAYSAYVRWYGGREGSRWLHDGVDWGWMWHGSYSQGYRSTRVHRAGPYAVTVVGPDSGVAGNGWSFVRWREPRWFRGVPL